jgi:phenylalanyl-tRNA synthetase beta chain
MQFSENWLRSYVNPDWSTDRLAEELTMAGLEVEDTKPAAPTFSGVVVAQVLAMQRHPNADKLNVCEVNAGEGKTRQIVCGAPNVAVGAKVPCALPDAVLPGDFVIRPVTMRGVESAGMLCSANELRISEESNGLLILPDDAPIGKNLRDYLALDDTVFTIKLTPNRPDCLGVFGIAREVSALSGAALCDKAMLPIKHTIADTLGIKVLAPDLCGRFAGRVIKGVNARAATPEWMRQRLERAGQRSISALVDISNYVMLELSRPTHVFDLAKITGSLSVRWAKSGETLKLLNGNTVTLDETVGVIADDHQVESLAGIMGGDSTAVSLETKDIFVEAAFWWPKAIAGRARRFNFSTDAGHRFERGVDAQSIIPHLDYMTSLILEICGGDAGPTTDIVNALPQRKPVAMRIERARRIIGANVTAADMAQSFTRLGFEFTQDSQAFTVIPPSYRFDINIEEDLIEEVVRLWGFNNLPQRPAVAPAYVQGSPEAVSSASIFKRAVAARGYQEVVNFSFVSATLNQQLLANASLTSSVVALQNPIAAHLDHMRSTLWTSLIDNLQMNLNRQASRVRIFEVGRVFAKAGSAVSGPFAVRGISQPKRIGLLAYGARLQEQWGSKPGNVDFFDMKGDIESLLGRRLPDLVVSASNAHHGLHPGRAAHLSLKTGQEIGWLGELHPRIAQALNLPLSPILAELDLDLLLSRDIPDYSPLANTPVVERDLAFVVQSDLPSKILIEQIQLLLADTSDATVVKNITLFDEYRGKGLENKEKSLAIRLSMQDTASTLTDSRISAILDLICAGLTTKGLAKLRA